MYPFALYSLNATSTGKSEAYGGEVQNLCKNVVDQIIVMYLGIDALSSEKLIINDKIPLDCKDFYMPSTIEGNPFVRQLANFMERELM